MDNVKGLYTDQQVGMAAEGPCREMTLDEMLSSLETRIDVAEEGVRNMRHAARNLRDKIRTAVHRKASNLRHELAELEQFEKR